MSVEAAVRHVLSILRDADPTVPFSFIVIVPKRSHRESGLFEDSEFFIHKERVLTGRHVFMNGMQHRHSGEWRTWPPRVDTEIYWYQNRAGSEMWPVGNGRARSITEEWHRHYSGLDSTTRASRDVTGSSIDPESLEQYSSGT